MIELSSKYDFFGLRKRFKGLSVKVAKDISRFKSLLFYDLFKCYLLAL